jgi:hypothetical protein
VARSFELPVATRVLLGLGLAGLAAGALLGLSVAYPVLVPAVSRVGLGRALDPEEWDRPAEEHLIRASRARLSIVAESRDVNGGKARRLRWAVWAAAAGVAFLLAAIIVALAVGGSTEAGVPMPSTP